MELSILIFRNYLCWRVFWFRNCEA